MTDPRSELLADPVLEYGDRAAADAGLILRSTVGSGVHGIAIAGTDDHDEMAVFVEPSAWVLGLQPHRDSYVARSQAEGERSGPGDTDLVAYTLRKYLRLAVKGNPTALLPLFAPPRDVLTVTPLGAELRGMATSFLSREAAQRFLGFMRGQRDRLVTGRDTPNRPELVTKHGYDCHLDDTEFLTRRGWLTYDRIEDEDVGTIASDGTVEFQRPSARIEKPYDGPILFGRTRYSSWAVTPNHRMWVSKIHRGPSGTRGEGYDPALARWEFRRADRITSVSWHTRVAASPRGVDWPGASDPYLALVGAYVAEGCVGKRHGPGREPSVLRFEQKDGGRLHATMDLVATEFRLRTYRYPDRRPVTIWTLADRQVATDVAKACGEGSRLKRLPEWAHQLSGRQADVLLDALLSGDGTPYRTGGWVSYTTSPGLAGDVQALAVSAGRRSNVGGPYAPAGVFQVFVADADPLRELEGFRARQHLRVENVTDRRIVCFTVPNERLVTRRDGRVAMHGNTKYASHALRLAYQGLEITREGTLTLPMPEVERRRVLQVKAGEVPELRAVLAEIDAVAAEVEDRLATGRTPLPERADVAAIGAWSVSAHRRHWGWS
jgi:hypothetical protein